MSVHPVDLEPSLLGDRTYASRRRFTTIDVAAVFSIMICLLYLLPARLVIPELTGVSRPALMIALALWCWWVMVRLKPRLIGVGPQPLRWAALGYFVALLLSYAAGVLRGLNGVEANGQDLSVLAVLQLLGVLLMAADGIPNWERLNAVLRTLVWCAGFMAFIGLLQFFLKHDVTAYMILPGFAMNGGLVGFEERGAGFFRVAGTATHYIEFSAVLATVLPFAIHFARFATSSRHRQAFFFVAMLIAVSIPVALSRTGVVALAVATVVMIPAWSWRIRYNIMVLAGLAIGALIVLVPGLLGTLTGLLTVSADDPSIWGRTKDYELVSSWYAQRPLLGRGPGTLIPQLYQGVVLDNEWLYTLVCQGLVGVVALAALHLTCIVLAFIAYRRSTRPEERHLCAALISAVLISIVVAGTFDSFGFTTYALTVALLMGVCGTVWRFTHPQRIVRTLTVWRFVD